MNIDISSIAYAIRSNTAASTLPVKLSQAQQCIAAALGYKSLAAWQASSDKSYLLDEDSHIVLDADLLKNRSEELQMPHDAKPLLTLVHEAFVQKLPGIGLHDSIHQFEDAIRNQLEDAVVNHDETSAQMAMTNSDGLKEVYLPFDIDWDAMTADGADDGRAIHVDGQITMEIALDRPYCGHRINVQARVWIARLGRRVYDVACNFERAHLDQDYGDDDQEDARPKVSLAEALADELGLEWYEADQLVEAHVQEIEGHEEMVYGYIFDFSNTDADESVLEKIQERYGSLSVRVSLNFFERVHGRDADPVRHYVHGDKDERGQDRYYCLHCDNFVAAEHFESEHPGKAEELYFSSLNAWSRTPAANKVNRRRPRNAINVLASTALAQRQGKELARSSFHRWLEEQATRKDAVGDLAKDVMRDHDFPTSMSTKEQIGSYLRRAGSSVQALKVFDAAWKECSLIRT